MKTENEGRIREAIGKIEEVIRDEYNFRLEQNYTNERKAWYVIGCEIGSLEKAIEILRNPIGVLTII